MQRLPLAFDNPLSDTLSGVGMINRSVASSIYQSPAHAGTPLSSASITPSENSALVGEGLDEGLSKSAGRTEFEGVTVKRGVVQDDGFAAWVDSVGAASDTGFASADSNDSAKKIAGMDKFESVALERGVVSDSGFSDWINDRDESSRTTEYFRRP